MKKSIMIAGFIAGLAMIPTVSAASTGLDDSTCFTKSVSDNVYTVTGSACTGKTFEIDQEDTVTIDLADQTISEAILTVKGNLIIKGATGTLGVKENIRVDGGTLTLQSGNITSTSYGIYAKNGGRVTIDGGTITSESSALAGNNTTGKAYFTVNGGTLKSNKGPAIYMPTAGEVTITNGIIDGGIFARMGKIAISGGEIKAQTASLDDLETAYTGQNVWLGSALYTFAGTYTTTEENNDLELNITGGNFSTTYEGASGISIYNFGKAEQKTSVNISGNAVLTANEGVEAYRVYSLDDMAIPGLDEAYEAETNTIETEITGGSFSKIDVKYINGDYTLVDGKVVSKESLANEETSSTEEAKNPDTSDTVLYSVIAIVIACLGITFTFRKLHNN